MSVPRVFISSTYYDLKEVRSSISNFISTLGYEPVMHEKAGVAYTQRGPLEEDCYRELAGCDIVVGIIGSRFGTQSSSSALSITMTELRTALKYNKKVYIFISNDVYIENRTYQQNLKNSGFQSAYTDDLRLHAFILELRNTVNSHVIEPFETTDQIIFKLRLQFAGLFQDLLTRETPYRCIGPTIPHTCRLIGKARLNSVLRHRKDR